MHAEWHTHVSTLCKLDGLFWSFIFPSYVLFTLYVEILAFIEKAYTRVLGFKLLSSIYIVFCEVVFVILTMSNHFISVSWKDIEHRLLLFMFSIGI